jgi:hypothetical protein
VFPRVLGLASPFLSGLSVVPLVLIPLAFAYAILKWRLWDVEIFVREALATTAAVLLGGMTFVLLNALLDRTFEGMAEAGKNVVAFTSGLVLAALFVPMKKRITGVLERIQYHDTYRARRALLDIARDFSTPRAQEDVGLDRAARRVGLRRPVRPLPLRGRQRRGGRLGPALRRLATEDVRRLRGPPSARRTTRRGTPARRLQVSSPRAAGHPRRRARRRPQDGARAALSEDEASDGRPGQAASFRERARATALPSAGRDPQPAAVPGERHPPLLVGIGPRRRRPHHSANPSRGDRGPDRGGARRVELRRHPSGRGPPGRPRRRRRERRRGAVLQPAR